MLKEKIRYADHLPVNVIVAEMSEYPIHFHEDPELVYLLSGSMTLRNGYYTYTMRAGDVFVMNDREIHSFYRTDESNIAMILQIDAEYFSGFCPDLKNSFFVTDMDDPDVPEMDALKTILSRVIMESLSADADASERIIGHTYGLLSLLMEEFQYFSMENGRFVNVTKNKTNKILAGRMNRIQDYLYDNYNKRLTLGEIADREHLSVCYLSHVIKAATGLSFKEFLNFIRVEESERHLLGTEMKVADISDAVGFSATRYYVKYFTKWFGTSPAEYREKHPGHVGGREVSATYRKLDAREIADAVKIKFSDIYREYASDARPPATVISADLRSDGTNLPLRDFPPYRMFRGSVRGAASLLCDMLEGLDETVADAGAHHLITVRRRGGAKGKGAGGGGEGYGDGVSVLIRNTEESVACGRAEYLVRLAGCSGTYDIRRIACSGTGAAVSPRETRTPDGERQRSEREELRRRVDAFPTVTRARMTAVDSLTFRVTIEGFGGELILMDRCAQI
ncbi:MAG: AraC family transcriptional regulator [Clostridiales Family XIII bacterium]|jgi:AraC-like DNA-binding protein|nr:AraC family transcriptional regulator [Clostridiales Family XIII bacterium]